VERFLAARSPSAEVVIVGASRGAADDFARTTASRMGATFGLARFSLTELASRVAAAGLAGAHRVPGTRAGAEATAARAVFDAVAAGDLEYFAPVALMPGFPRALAGTLHELRLASISPERLAEARWSPDGKWISFLVDDHSYYVVHPNGDGKKLLFKAGIGVTELQWSPDSRFVAYVSARGIFERSLSEQFVELTRLRVRRLDDSFEEWFLNLTDTDPISFQWVQSPNLLGKAQ
jgi:hypothetical protein